MVGGYCICKILKWHEIGNILVVQKELELLLFEQITDPIDHLKKILFDFLLILEITHIKLRIANKSLTY